MTKDKLILADHTAIETEMMPSIGAITTKCADLTAVQALKDKLTSENLKLVQTTNSSGIVVGSYSELALYDVWTIQWVEDGVLASFGLREKSVEEKKIDELTETVEQGFNALAGKE